MRRSHRTWLGVLLLAAAPAFAQNGPDSAETSAQALKEMIDRGETMLIIDVRSEEEVQSGSIPGAIHIPEDRLEARMADIPKDVRLVFT